jgi:hypothetical protein
MDMRARFWLTTLLCLVSAGCAEVSAPEKPPPPGPGLDISRDYRECETGACRGRVTWSGPRPQAPPFKIFGIAGFGHEEEKERANPHLPIVDEQSGGVAGAVVFLRQVDLAKSRPWFHPSVRLEQSKNVLRIHQGEVEAASAFVRRGDTIDIVNRDPHLHVLRAGGADFFSSPFPDKDKFSSRRMNERGVVELASGAGYFWMSGHLFVDDHPYYTRTDSQGHFVLDKVPARTYQLVCRLPHWEVVKKERDSESAFVHRLFFRSAVESERSVEVVSGRTTESSFSWSLVDFE